jgi:prepilin-type N-terminal cleavage/methylation domain-containing protein/prepilin-type processing-associated H-X9-DG protein
MAGKKGFTLIELLVVIAIIALMLSVLVPALKAVKERGKRAVCMNNLRQMNMAYFMYAQLYGGRFVPVEIWDYKMANDALGSGGYDITLPSGDVVTPWIPVWCGNKAFIKLLDQTGAENRGYHLVSNPEDYYALPVKFRCPSYPRGKVQEGQDADTGTVSRTSYAPNTTDWGRVVEETNDENSHRALIMEDKIWNKGVVVAEIKRPATKILFTDAQGLYLSNAWDLGNYVNHWDEHGEILGKEDVVGDGHGAEPSYRHSDGANIAFCDGHVEYRKKKEMFYFLDGNRPNLAATNVDTARNDRLWCYFK